MLKRYVTKDIYLTIDNTDSNATIEEFCTLTCTIVLIYAALAYLQTYLQSLQTLVFLHELVCVRTQEIVCIMNAVAMNAP